MGRNAMPPSALQMLNKAWLLLFIDDAREVVHPCQVLHVTRPIYSQLSLEIVAASVDVLVYFSCFFALGDDYGEFLTGSGIDYEHFGEGTHDPGWFQQCMLRVCVICEFL